MTKTTVINVYGRERTELEADPNFVYVGRKFSYHYSHWPGSVFGNPFKPLAGYSARTAVRDFEAALRFALAGPDDFRSDWRFVIMARKLPELRGKVLGCWCCDWPGFGDPEKPCHAVVLARLADEGVAP